MSKNTKPELKSLASLKKINVEAGKDPKEIEEKAASESKGLAKVKDLKKAIQPKAKAKSSSPEILEEYMKILADGELHFIRDLLDHFGLEHTSNGREKLRKCNKLINGKEDVKFNVVKAHKDAKAGFQFAEKEAA